MPVNDPVLVDLSQSNEENVRFFEKSHENILSVRQKAVPLHSLSKKQQYFRRHRRKSSLIDLHKQKVVVQEACTAAD